MNAYDEKIIALEKKIKKLLDDIDKKKARVAELRLECKQLQADKDKEYSEKFISAIREYGVQSEEDRQALIETITELLAERSSSDSSEKPELPEAPITPPAEIISNPAEQPFGQNHQKPVYPETFIPKQN